MRQVTGTLLKPDGSAWGNQRILFRAVVSEGPTLLGGTAFETETDGAGVYDVTIEAGRYGVELWRGLIAGTIEITSGAAVDLPTLLAEGH